jgi:tRNA A-37 threonylcarbamoyl transferase component Bud32
MSATAAPAGKGTIAPGTVLGERFEVESVVGQGAMGIVYRAKDRTTGEPAAVKVLHRQLVQSREYLSRFKREASAASRFRHEAAVRVIATGEAEERQPYIAMDLVAGKSLRDIVLDGAPMVSGRAANIVQQLLRALGAAHHAGIVHRDMKPDNIRIVIDEDGIERPKILDFGVAKFISGDIGEVDGGLKTKTGIVLGTPKYMAPEQIRGEAVDGRADIYSVGAILHEMLTGKPPFEAEDVFGFVAMHLKEQVPALGERFPEIEIPEELDELVLSMLEKDPRDRPGDAAALADQLASFAVEDPRAAEKGRALTRGAAAVAAGGFVGAAAGWFLAGSRAGETASSAPVVAAAALMLGLGAAAAAKMFPRPSVYGFVKRVAVVSLALLVGALASIPLSSAPFVLGMFAASGFALTALLAYAGYLLVWNSRSLWMRPLVAGIAAPLLAATLLPVLVAPAGHDPYFVRLLGTSAAAVADTEGSARSRAFLGALAIALTFGLASMLLPRPGAARR